MKSKPTLELLESRIAPAFAATFDLSAFAVAHVDGHSAGDNAGFSVADAGDFNGDGINDFIVGAPFTSDVVNTGGTAYIVFGKDGGLPGTTDLNNLAAGTGVRIDGVISGANLGRAVAGAGDVNGDGFDDVIIGAPLANINADSGSGIAYVIFGSASPAASMTTNSISGVNGFAVFGASPGDLCGISVGGAGDVNGDGFADVIVGASGIDVPQPGNPALLDAGGAVVIYGHAGPFISFTNFAQVGLGSVNPGIRLTGVAAGDHAGSAVSSAGDFDGDGIDDILIGASGEGVGGAAYVVLGAKNLPPLASLAGNFKITGIASGDGLGDAVAKAGDVNGDGFSDIILGATGNDSTGNNSGESDVFFGGPNRTGTISALNADIRLQGSGTNALAGGSVSTAGDFNGDGYADLLIGATHASVAKGEAYIVFGRPDGFQSPIDLSALDGTNGVKIVGTVSGDDGGFSVSGIGDINDDGFDDVLFAAPNHAGGGKTDSGSSYIVYGGNGANKVNLSADGRSATYTDADGDLVTVKVNKGTLSQNDFDLSGQNSLGGSTLQKFDLTAHTDLKKANITVTAKPQVIDGVLRGDGHANVGALDAAGIALGKVMINGDLGRITAQGNGALLPAVKTLSVYSFGEAGAVTQNSSEISSVSLLFGNIGALKVKTNVADTQMLVGKIGTATIGGDLLNSSLVVVGDGSPKNAAAALAVKAFTVKGDFDNSSLLGGAFLSGNPDIQLGRITIGGDFRASNITAGVSSGDDGLRGTADDSVFASGTPSIVSRIASVVIKGQAVGTLEAGGHFGIVAEQIGKVQVGGVKLALSKTAKDKLVALGATGDLVVNEV